MNDFIRQMLQLGAELEKTESPMQASMIVNDAEILYRDEIKALTIPVVIESISITKNELQSFLEDWDDGKQNAYDAEWNGLSKRLANFMGLLTP